MHVFPVDLRRSAKIFTNRWYQQQKIKNSFEKMWYLHQVTFASVGFRHVANTYFEGFCDSSNCLTMPKPNPRLQPVIKIEFIILFPYLFNFDLNFQIFNAINASQFFFFSKNNKKNFLFIWEFTLFDYYVARVFQMNY